MSVTFKYSEEKNCLICSGDLDVYSAPDFASEMIGLLKKGKDCELDLSGCTRCDTSALQVLISAKKSAASRNISPLRIIGHPPDLIRMLDLYGLIGNFKDPIKLSKTLKATLALRYGLKRGVS